MEIVAFGDPHVKPGGSAVDYDALSVPPDVDVVVTTGDVVHRTGRADIEAGREFFERLDEGGVPVVCVPGNHDPLPHYEELVGGLPNVTIAHERVLAGEELGGSVSDELGGLSVVGWGCESFDCEPEIRLTGFESLDPREASDRRYAADRAASRLEDAVYEYLRGDRSASALRRRLDVARAERSRFETQLRRAEERYDLLDGLLAAAEGPTAFLAHVPPYNTPLDRHHSIGRREADLEGLHVGSLAEKLALRKHRPLVALSGHSHRARYRAGIDGEGGRPNMLNLGFRRVVRVSVGSEGAFGFDFL